jgi:hypothetical protein
LCGRKVNTHLPGGELDKGRNCVYRKIDSNSNAMFGLFFAFGPV